MEFLLTAADRPTVRVSQPGIQRLVLVFWLSSFAESCPDAYGGFPKRTRTSRLFCRWARAPMDAHAVSASMADCRTWVPTAFPALPSVRLYVSVRTMPGNGVYSAS